MQKVSNIWSHILDLVFPRPAVVKALEEMSPEEYRLYIPKADFIDEQTITLFAYGSEYTHSLVWHIKYRGNMRLAQKAAEVLYEELVESLSEKSLFENFGQPILIPVPLGKKKFRSRGFNQSEVIAERLAKLLGDSLEYSKSLLIKIRDTESQSHTHSRTERLNNLANCFAVTKPELVKGKNVILLDDVITTGATTSEAMKTLRNAGAKKILRVAVAH